MTYPDPEYLALNIVALDFDGVLVENNWPSPEFGDPIKEGAAILAHYSKDNAVVIFTSRPASHKQAIADWLRLHGLAGFVYDIVCDKLKAALYIDDRAWNPWEGQEGGDSDVADLGPTPSKAPAAPLASRLDAIPEEEIEDLEWVDDREVVGVPV